MNYKLFAVINELAGHNNLLDDFMIHVTDGAIFVYGATLLIMWFTGYRYKQTIIYAGITSLIVLLVNFIIRKTYMHPRPFVEHSVQLLTDHAANSSFPSNHTSGAFALSIAIFLFHRRIGSFLISFALLTGFSRIFVGHHYPFDILGSILIATVIGLFVYKNTRLFEPIVQLILNIYQRLPFVKKRPKTGTSSSPIRRFK